MDNDGSSSQFIAVASVGDIPVGGAVSARVGELVVAVFNVDGNYHALEDRCSHAGAALSTSDVDGTVVTCRYHGAKFDITNGKVLCEPAAGDVRSFPVHVEGDEIKVEVPAS